jgi:hypothetical protein
MTMSPNGSTERLANGVRVGTAIPAITGGPLAAPEWSHARGERHAAPEAGIPIPVGRCRLPHKCRAATAWSTSMLCSPVRSRLVAGTVDTAGVCALVTTF